MVKDGAGSSFQLIVVDNPDEEESTPLETLTSNTNSAEADVTGGGLLGHGF